jgi:hypothetical protein
MLRTAATGRRKNAAQSVRKFGSRIYKRNGLNIVAVILLTFGLSTNLHTEEAQKKIASGGLNEFDAARFCSGATYVSEPDLAKRDDAPKGLHVPRSRFGFASPDSQKGGASEFLYVTSQYYVRVGPSGDPAGCEFKHYLYRSTKGNLFKEEEIDEKKFSELVGALGVFEQTYRRRSGVKTTGKLFGEADTSEADSIGGCLLPIQWFLFRGKFYALFSLSQLGVVQYVIPHYERGPDGSPSTCNAWGERHLANSNIISGWLLFFPLSSDFLFVELREYQKGFWQRLDWIISVFGETIFFLIISC